MNYNMVLHVDTDEIFLRIAIKNAKNYIKELPEEKFTVIILLNSKAVKLMHQRECNCTEEINELLEKGVKFYVCQNAMREHGVESADLVPGLTTIPAGIVRLVELQREGFAYVKP